MANKKRETTIDDVLQAVNHGFTEMERRFDSIEQKIEKIEKDIEWIKKILEANATDLKRLEEERIFTLSYVKRLEKEIEKIKAHLKIA